MLPALTAASGKAGLVRREVDAAWAGPQQEVEALTKEVIGPGVVVVREAEAALLPATKRPRAPERALAAAGPESELGDSEDITDNISRATEVRETCTAVVAVTTEAAETAMAAADPPGGPIAERAAEEAESTGCLTLKHLFFLTRFFLNKMLLPSKEAMFRVFTTSISRSMMRDRRKSSLSCI